MIRQIVWWGKWLKMMRATAEPGETAPVVWEYVERGSTKGEVPGVVIIVAITDERKILFVEQHRIPVEKNCIELPAGLAGDKGKESDEDAVRRELAEESGYEAGKISYLGHGVVTPGLTSEMAAMYLAIGLKKIPNPPKDPDENIILHEVPLAEADKWLAEKRKEGKIIDWKCYTGIHFARQRKIKKVQPKPHIPGTKSIADMVTCDDMEQRPVAPEERKDITPERESDCGNNGCHYASG